MPLPGAMLYRVKTFTEKPNLALAQQFVNSGDFLWNAGLFIWRASVVLAAFDRYLPDLAEVFESGQAALGTPQEVAFIDSA